MAEGRAGGCATRPFPERLGDRDDILASPWDRTFQTGLKGTLYGMRAAFPYMREEGGKIINFGSGNGIAGLKGSAAYDPTKEAIRTLSRAAAIEWGK